MPEKLKVLIVDDEPEIGNLLKMFLEDDYDVTTFADPRLACDHISQSNYNLVISDIKMPHLTGLDVMKHVKSIKPNTHVVLITGHAQTERDKAEVRELGAAGVLFKPFGDPAKVLGYLAEVMNSQPLMPRAEGAFADGERTTNISTTESKILSGKPLVMIIDDEPDLIEILKMMLEDNYDVMSFDNPLDALNCLDSYSFQMIMTDLNMPQMSGVEVIQKIRSKNSKVPVMIMSGHSEREKEVIAALSAGGTSVMPKPFPDQNIVIQKIEKLIKP